jgi:hypothetical protein
MDQPRILEVVCLNFDHPERTFMVLFRNSKAILVTGSGCLEGCEMSKIPYCLDNQLTDSEPYMPAMLYQQTKIFWY